MDAAAPRDERRHADGEVVWSWPCDARVNPRIKARWRGKKSCTPGIPCALVFEGGDERIARTPPAPQERRRCAGRMVDLSPTSNQNKFARRDGRSGRIRTCDPCVPNVRSEQITQ